MGKETLATYDLMWIRKDPERAEIVAECNNNIDVKYIDNKNYDTNIFEK